MFIFVLIITIKKIYFYFLNDKNKEENKIKRQVPTINILNIEVFQVK